MLFLLLSLFLGTRAQLRARESNGCTKQFEKCVLDGQETECYDDKDLVAFCREPNSCSKAFPFQCGWNVNDRTCVVGQPCRNHGRFGVCANKEEVERGDPRGCVIQDTTCDGGDPWCFKDAKPGRCVAGLCDTSTALAAPVANPAVPPPVRGPVQLCRHIVKTATFNFDEPELLEIDIDAAQFPVVLNGGARVIADAPASGTRYEITLELVSTNNCLCPYQGASFVVERANDTIVVRLRGLPPNIPIAAWQPELEWRNEPFSQCSWSSCGESSGTALSSRSAVATIATTIASAYVMRPAVAAPVIIAALACGALASTTASAEEATTATPTSTAQESSTATSRSLTILDGWTFSRETFDSPVSVRSDAPSAVPSALPTAASSDSSCSAFVRVSFGIASEKLKAPCTFLTVPVRLSWDGARPSPSFQAVSNGCAYGRPFVTGNSPVLAKASSGTDNDRAARWVSQGLGEHASVASFAAFSLQLMINGAPFSLLTGAAKANADEVRHAEQSFALASRFAGRQITAEPFPRHAISSMQPQSLEELAVAAFREGCIAETLSVFDAARQVDENDVVDDEERNVLIGIVRDEARHSALAWRTVAWATGTAHNAALNKRLKQIVVEESARCVAHHCNVFERLILPLSAGLVGTSEWPRVVESEDVDVEIDPSHTLTESTIESILATF
jgi:hypothetical protein